LLVVAVALALAAAASRVIANPVGIPPTAKPFDVIEGQTISIELGTPTAHGWYVLIWGSYTVGEQEFLANGAAKEGEFNPGSGCVYIAWEGGGLCFFPSESQATGRVSFSSRSMAGHRSRSASFRPHARMAPSITGSTTRHKRGRGVPRLSPVKEVTGSAPVTGRAHPRPAATSARRYERDRTGRAPA
jgi:hypothetical protein